MFPDFIELVGRYSTFIINRSLVTYASVNGRQLSLCMLGDGEVNGYEFNDNASATNAYNLIRYGESYVPVVTEEPAAIDTVETNAGTGIPANPFGQVNTVPRPRGVTTATPMWQLNDDEF